MTCPTCNGDCRQGRDCPAQASVCEAYAPDDTGDRPPMTSGDRLALLALFALLVAFWGSVALASAVAGS